MQVALRTKQLHLEGLCTMQSVYIYICECAPPRLLHRRANNAVTSLWSLRAPFIYILFEMRPWQRRRRAEEFTRGAAGHNGGNEATPRSAHRLLRVVSSDARNKREAEVPSDQPKGSGFSEEDY